tara:strand:+ start:2284 stop:3018 length:735 start_codon:yes stop_codon:yes gene_type:complete
MTSTVIIIPSRLKAKRLPNKPLKLIKGKEIILHVYNLAVKSGAGEVLVTTPDKTISELIDSNGGKSFLSKESHETGTDRVFEAFKSFYSSEPKIIINLQGDMPNLDHNSILLLSDYLNKGLCDVATLASSLKNKSEIEDKNVVKVFTNNNIEKSGFSEALDFKRVVDQTKNKFIYHHIGIYGFTSKALIRYVNLKRSKLELERNLEQMRALENNMKIHVGHIQSSPLGIDTEKDFLEVKKSMEQ